MVEWHRGGGEGEGEQHYLVSYQLESKVWNGGRLATRNVEITLHSFLLFFFLWRVTNSLASFIVFHEKKGNIAKR